MESQRTAMESILTRFGPRTIERETLQKERRNCPFDVTRMENILDGGPHATSMRRAATRAILNDPILNEGLKVSQCMTQLYDMSLEEQRVLSTKKVLRLGEVFSRLPKDRAMAYYKALSDLDDSAGIRFFVQYVLWIGTITNQGSEAQKAKWLDGAAEMKVIGCFGMTELGHSSHLRGAETIATFDNETDEFVIDSTALTATKWWIGQAGQIATHCIAFANLVCNGTHCGIQLFVVPIRNHVTGLPLPGVVVGDLGPKFGRNGNDNGFIHFCGVRIPRENMLSRWAQVDRDGTFHPPPNPAIVYGSTISERVGSVSSAAHFASMGLTIAVRFGAIRRQGAGDPEPQILDYQTHQKLLIPHVAQLYSTIFAKLRIGNLYQTMLSNLEGGNVAGFLQPLAEVHATSCGLKAFCGWWAADVLEACRRSMGGHAYSDYSGIPRLITGFGVLTTGGGDNVVLAQQTARYLLSTLRRVRAGVAISAPSVQYLEVQERPGGEMSLARCTSFEDVDPKIMLRAFRDVSVHLLEDAATQLQYAQMRGISKAAAWNAHQCKLVDAAEAHTHVYLLETTLRYLSSEVVKSMHDPNIRQALDSLCRLFALRSVEDRIMSFIATGALLPVQIPLLQKGLVHAIAHVRPMAVGLMDAFGIDDGILRAPLGAYDGDIYTRYSRAVAASRVNEDMPASYWKELIQPRTQGQSQAPLHSAL